MGLELGGLHTTGERVEVILVGYDGLELDGVEWSEAQDLPASWLEAGVDFFVDGDGFHAGDVLPSSTPPSPAPQLCTIEDVKRIFRELKASESKS